MYDDHFPKWLGRAILEDDLPWDNLKTVNLNEFLDMYTLHDSEWVRLINDPNFKNNVLLVIRLDSVWFPTKQVKKTSKVTQWPLLFLEINEVNSIEFMNYDSTDCARIIAYSKVNECESYYQLEIGDILSGLMKINYLGDTRVLSLNENKEILEIE